LRGQGGGGAGGLPGGEVPAEEGDKAAGGDIAAEGGGMERVGLEQDGGGAEDSGILEVSVGIDGLDGQLARIGLDAQVVTALGIEGNEGGGAGGI